MYLEFFGNFLEVLLTLKSKKIFYFKFLDGCCYWELGLQNLSDLGKPRIKNSKQKKKIWKVINIYINFEGRFYIYYLIQWNIQMRYDFEQKQK